MDLNNKITRICNEKLKTPFNIDISMPIPSQPVSWWEERKKKHQQGDISWSNTKFFKLDNEKYRYVEEHTGNDV